MIKIEEKKIVPLIRLNDKIGYLVNAKFYILSEGRAIEIFSIANQWESLIFKNKDQLKNEFSIRLHFHSISIMNNIIENVGYETKDKIVIHDNKINLFFKCLQELAIQRLNDIRYQKPYLLIDKDEIEKLLYQRG